MVVPLVSEEMPLAGLPSDDFPASGLGETLTGSLMCFKFHEEHSFG
jgi:hypothetical protein